MSYHRIDVRHARLLFPVHYGKKRKFRRRTERGRKQLSSVVNQNSVANTGSGTDKHNKGFGFPTQKMWVCVSTSRQPPRYNSLWVFSMTGKLRWQAWKLWFRGFFWGLLTTLRLHVYIREESLSKNWMSPHLTNRNVISFTHQISCSPYIGSPNRFQSGARNDQQLSEFRSNFQNLRSVGLWMPIATQSVSHSMRHKYDIAKMLYAARRNHAHNLNQAEEGINQKVFPFRDWVSACFVHLHKTIE